MVLRLLPFKDKRFQDVLRSLRVKTKLPVVHVFYQHLIFILFLKHKAVNAGSPANSTNRKTNGIVKKQFIDYGAGGGGAEGESFMSNDASTFTRQQQTSQEGEGSIPFDISFGLSEGLKVELFYNNLKPSASER